MITENLSTLKIHKLTQAQYERELEAGRIDENALYLTPDEEIDLSPYATVEDIDEALASCAPAVHEHTEYMKSDSPTFTSGISMGRKEGSAVGYDSVAIGRDCAATLEYCVAIGDTASATNFGATAIGTDVTASGIYAFAEGYKAQALGYVSHAEGAHTKTTGQYSHVEGYGTLANANYQHVQGSYNIEDSKYLHIVGNGQSDSSRSNAHTIDRYGNGWFAGTVECTGIILISPNGTKYQVSVSDSGALSTTRYEEEE